MPRIPDGRPVGGGELFLDPSQRRAPEPIEICKYLLANKFCPQPMGLVGFWRSGTHAAIDSQG